MMTKNLLSTTFLSSILALGTTAFLASASQAVEIEPAADIHFICDTDNRGTPTTYAVAHHGNTYAWRKPIIHWTAQYFSRSGYTPQQRCTEVSGRFNQLLGNYHESNDFHGWHQIQVGTVNRQPVICLVSNNLTCKDGLLFTLKPGENGARILNRLANIQDGASDVLYESEDDVGTYIDFNRWLESIPNEEISQQNDNLSPNSLPNEPSPSSPSEEIW